MSSASGTSSQIISLPKGGGALSGIGEKFAPDLHTGTGNFTVPIALPPGRNGFQPELSLVYSTGNGNGLFGLGWSLSIPGVSRKTSQGVPRYDDDRDTFILSGAEDLVPVEHPADHHTRFRPRTEGLFARIGHIRDVGAGHDYWRVESKDGLTSLYGTPGAAGADPATIGSPTDRARIFAWKLAETRDPFGNRIVYRYTRDTQLASAGDPHEFDQLYLSKIAYADYGDPADPQYLVRVRFAYEDRPDAFSEHRAGFEIRTRRRCTAITVTTHAEAERLVRRYRFIYRSDHQNGASLLTTVEVDGFSDTGTESRELPPLTFGYTRFEPGTGDLIPITGLDLPARSLADPALDLADLSGDGLPDFFEMNGTVRSWRNLGGGRFDLARPMRDAPAGLALADPDVQLIDADGDGRIDLLVNTPGLGGYFPLEFDRRWDRESFRRILAAPSFSFADPEVKLVDLNGDGVTDAIRAGSRLECFFFDPELGWAETRFVPRRTLETFPDVSFADPRVKWGDMSGDGLQDIVLIHSGSIAYWPNLGHGSWGRRIEMRGSPRLPTGYDLRRILLGDLDGDGLADLVYVEDTQIRLWVNQSGNGWGAEQIITGTPPVSDMDAVQLVDLLGSGVAGILWSRDAGRSPRAHYHFLDLTGGAKPYLLSEMDNHMGATTRVAYVPSTRYFLADEACPDARWQTPLPFPVQVVARVEVIDAISGGKLTTEYRYHHGYWDGVEREFRGFGMVEQLDTEGFADYSTPGLHGDTAFAPVAERHYSPPTLTKTWFHQGAVRLLDGEWVASDYSREYWRGDPQLLRFDDAIRDLLPTLDDPAIRRDALRTLRGSVLRTELYALDGAEGDERAKRPYTVTEASYGVREEGAELLPASATKRRHCRPRRIFFPHALAQRTTQWERGDDPMTQLGYSGDYDAFGQPRAQTAIACPRGWRTIDDPSAAFLATRSRTEYATPLDPAGPCIHDRVARATSWEIRNIDDGGALVERTVHELLALRNDSPTLRLIGQALSFYDGPAFAGLPFGQVGAYGAPVRSESLVLTEEILRDAYPSGIDAPDTAGLPPYLDPGAAVWGAEYPAVFRESLPIKQRSDPTRQGLAITPAGYGFADGAAGSPYARGHYVVSGRRRYDFHAGSGGRGLPLAMRDPLGRETTVDYDEPYQLLPVRVTDPARLTTQAEYNYRVLQPALVTDANDNRTAVAFTPMGLVASVAVMGKAGEQQGDTPNQPGARFSYDFLSFGRGEPASAHGVRRVDHRWEIVRQENERRRRAGLPALSDAEAGALFPPDELERYPERFVQSREYSDGFGRLLQTRAQGEEERFGDEAFGGGEAVLPPSQEDGLGGPIVGRANTDLRNPNVVVSGWQIYDNKGRVVEKYEPFFAEGWAYAAPNEHQLGQKARMFYDPRGQVIRTLNPDGSEQRVIYGVPGLHTDPPSAGTWAPTPADLANPGVFTPTPWEAYTYDANDLAPLSRDPRIGVSLAGHAPVTHHFTPASILIDALGRTVQATERNGRDAAGWHITRSTYDIQGNPLTVTDALGRLAFQYVYDMAKRPLRVVSIDAGVRRNALDAAGGALESRDSKGAVVLQAYDRLGRPTELWARDDGDGPITLREKILYGDDQGRAGISWDAARRLNLLGQVFGHYDEAGLQRFERHDFKGNLLDQTRWVIADAALAGGWIADWSMLPPTVDPNPIAAIDRRPYKTSVSYDALSRPVSIAYPLDATGRRPVLRLAYSRSGSLEQVMLDGKIYVERIVYDAKGQRSFITYGNGVITRYAYEPRTFRLARMRSERYRKPTGDTLTYEFAGGLLQDFAYDYDLAGNILAIHDRTSGCGLPLDRDRLDRAFSYDPIYRLLSATGRECAGPPPAQPWDDAPRCHDVTATQAYTQEYRYDPAGNIAAIIHRATGGSNRAFALAPGSNRLATMTIGATVYGYSYDANGNMTQETTSRHYRWDHADRLAGFAVRPGAGPASLEARYLYGADGMRVKKWVRRGGASEGESTTYIGEIFEQQRWYEGGAARENSHLHVMDDTRRIALVRRGPAHPDDRSPAAQYHLGDHLGSSNVVVVDSGDWLNREEHYPYGETSYGSFAKKRYRFTGKERDEESGLNYHAARYYAPWVGRWASCDPAGMVDGVNLYSYVGGNLLVGVDNYGCQTEISAKTKNIIKRAVDYTNSVISEINNIASPISLAVDTLDIVIDQAYTARMWQQVGGYPHRIPGINSVLNKLGNMDELIDMRYAISGNRVAGLLNVGDIASGIGVLSGLVSMTNAGVHGDVGGVVQGAADAMASIASFLGPVGKAFSAGYSGGQLANSATDDFLDRHMPNNNRRGVHGRGAAADIDNSISGHINNILSLDSAGRRMRLAANRGDRQTVEDELDELRTRSTNPEGQLAASIVDTTRDAIPAASAAIDTARASVAQTARELHNTATALVGVARSYFRGLLHQ